MPKGKRGAEAQDLDLIPIMNLVTILIPFLLMAAQFVSYAVIDSTLPAIGPPVPPDPDDTEEPLNLSLFVTDEGWTLAGSAEMLKVEGEGDEKGPTIDCITPACTYMAKSEGGNGPEEAYDVAALREWLNKIKDEYPDEKNVILVPEPDIPYEVVVLTMDATREDPDAGAEGGDVADAQCNGRCLFPFVVIAGGVEQ